MNKGSEEVDLGCALPFSRKGTWGRSLFISGLRFLFAEQTEIKLFLALLKHLCMLKDFFFWSSLLINFQHQPQWDELCFIIISILCMKNCGAEKLKKVA